MRLPGRSLSNTKQRKPELKIDLLPLQDWLTRAGIPSERLPALLARLSQHWVQDVPSLLRSLPALEMHLPAAAFQTIQNAATKEQAASQNEEGKEWRSSADTASDAWSLQFLLEAMHHPSNLLMALAFATSEDPWILRACTIHRAVLA